MSKPVIYMEGDTSDPYRCLWLDKQQGWTNGVSQRSVVERRRGFLRDALEKERLTFVSDECIMCAWERLSALAEKRGFLFHHAVAAAIIFSDEDWAEWLDRKEDE